MNKNNIKEMLIRMRTDDNESVVSYLLKSLDKVSDEELNLTFKQLNVSEENIDQYLMSLINRYKNQEENHDKFINVNEMFSYGRTGDTIHMHIIPEDLRGLKKELGDEAFYALYKEQLEDFLSKLQIIFSEDPTIKSLFAVSPVFFNQNISLVHESLGFDKLIEIDLNNETDKMSKEQKEFFLKMFNKDGVYKKKVYYTKMNREKLLETEYLQLPEEKTHLKI